MSDNTIRLHQRGSATKVPLRAPGSQVSVKSHSRPGLLALFLLVAGAQFAFGMWMNSHGFLWNDALSRATNALQVLHSKEPSLAAIGFVWMPLPSLIELLWVAFFPLWSQIVSSGFASTLTTALAGGATAALLLYTARRLGISDRLGWAFALVVAANPMLFLYASNGMSEGVAAPFLTGAVCFLVLFWHSGKRRYVTAAGLALALGFASLYEAVPYGAALFAAMILGLLRNSEGKQSMPQGRGRAVEALGILLLLPSMYLAISWVGANAAIMKDPFFFATSEYSNYGHTVTVGLGGRSVGKAAGDFLSTLLFVGERLMPFLIPGGFLLLVRALDGRVWRINTLSLVLLMCSVPVGFIAPLLYLGASFGWLRFFMYPLFVAAGWGLYEVALSNRPRQAAGLILASWIVAAPVIFWAMSEPERGQEENRVVTGILSGESSREVGFENLLDVSAPVADHISEYVLSDSQATVAADAFVGWPIAAQMPPEHLERFVTTGNRRFEDALTAPKKHNISYMLVPEPEKVPQDEVGRTYPKLWVGDEPGFELVKEFPTTPQKWRLYKVTERKQSSEREKS